MSAKTQCSIISAIAAIALAIAFLACGFAVCCLPQATNFLSANTSAFELSPYEPSELTALADATREFTVSDYGRSELGEQGAVEALAEKVVKAAEASSQEGSSVEGRWSSAAKQVLSSGADDGSTYADTMERLASVSQAYALDKEALLHLSDVNNVISRATSAIIGVAVLAAFCLLVVQRTWGTRAAMRILAWAGGGMCVALAVLGIWAAISFESLFAALHGLLFAAGTWVFPYDSLLICMYPTAFWMGMGVIWLATTGTLSILSLAAGLLLMRRARKLDAQDSTQAA